MNKNEPGHRAVNLIETCSIEYLKEPRFAETYSTYEMKDQVNREQKRRRKLN